MNFAHVYTSQTIAYGNGRSNYLNVRLSLYSNPERVFRDMSIQFRQPFRIFDNANNNCVHQSADEQRRTCMNELSFGNHLDLSHFISVSTLDIFVDSVRWKFYSTFQISWHDLYRNFSFFPYKVVRRSCNALYGNSRKPGVHCISTHLEHTVLRDWELNEE